MGLLGLILTPNGRNLSSVICQKVFSFSAFGAIMVHLLLQVLFVYSIRIQYYGSDNSRSFAKRYVDVLEKT